MHAEESLSLVGAADSGATTHQDGDSADVPLQQNFLAASLRSYSHRSEERDACRVQFNFIIDQCPPQLTGDLLYTSVLGIIFSSFTTAA